MTGCNSRSNHRTFSYRLRPLFAPVLALIFTLALAACNGGSQNGAGSVTPTITPTGIPTSSPSGTPTSELSARLTNEINRYIAEHETPANAGVSLLVVKDGEVAYHNNIGFADNAASISVNRHTGFRLASVSKPFTAIAIMQLVEQGEIHLNDSILIYLPELDDSWQPITLKMLLIHTSGIYDLLNDIWSRSRLEDLTNAGALEYFISNPALKFTPGSQTSYSNSGYNFLALIIERVTGYSFSDYMRLYLFQPAGMADSYITDKHQPMRLGDALNFATSSSQYGINTYLTGNMAQVSSSDDFIHFFRALRENLLISNITLANMTYPRTELFGGGYGYGFMLTETSYGHAGLWDGYRTEMTIVPDKNLEFVVLTSGGSATQHFTNGIKAIVNRLY